VPLFKSGDKRNVSCFWGISILSAIPQIFEKMMCDKVTTVVRPVISDAQHGFVKGRSTVSNLVQFPSTESIMDGRLTESKMGGNSTCQFYLGGSLLCWMRSY
jgi:hypothetical protein